jgi:hypothetical protein
VGTFSTTEVMTLYLDGVYQSTYTENAPQSFSGWWRIGSFGFGTYNWGGNPSNGYFPGDIVAVQVYSVSLTAANVTANYRALMANGTLLPNSVFCPIGIYNSHFIHCCTSHRFCDVIAHFCVFLTICLNSGRFNGNFGVTACTRCPAGSMCPSIGLTAATACEAGSFQGSVGATFCTTCSANFRCPSGSTVC